VNKKYPAIIEGYSPKGWGSHDETESLNWMLSLSRAMGEYFKEGMKILDYGCGSVRYANFLSEQFKKFKYYGIEIKGGSSAGELMNVVAPKFVDKRIKLGLIDDDIEFEAYDNVDVVVLGSIFTHLAFHGGKNNSFVGIMDKIKKVVYKGGIIVFSTFIDETEHTNGGGNAYAIKDCYGLSYYTLENIDKYMKNNKLKALEVESFLAQGIHNHRIFRVENE